MQIDKNKVVRFHFTLKDADGTLLQTTDGQEPLAYLHGYGAIVRGLEREMSGRRAGDEFSVTVKPEDGFGIFQPEAVQRVPIKHLEGSGRLQVGTVVVVNTRQGRAQGTVRKLGRFNVDVDFNHPMSGRTLSFDVKILEVREATSEEIRHRHAHGPGGTPHA